MTDAIKPPSEVVAAIERIKKNARQLMRSYYEARGGHMVDGHAADAEIASFAIEDECNAIITANAPPDRLERHGAELFKTAKQLGWPDDGESPLNFIARHERERGRASAPTANAPVGEPVAYQYRFRPLGTLEWSEWADCGPDNRAPVMRGGSYEIEERPLYTHPPVAVGAETWKRGKTGKPDRATTSNTSIRWTIIAGVLPRSSAPESSTGWTWMLTRRLMNTLVYTEACCLLCQK